jgi:hypothetical protein
VISGHGGDFLAMNSFPISKDPRLASHTEVTEKI